MVSDGISHAPRQRIAFEFIQVALAVAALAFASPVARAGPCDLTWNGEAVAQNARLRNPALTTRLIDNNKNVVAELTGAQILAISEAKDAIARQLGRSPSLIFCSDKAPNAFATTTPNGEVVGVTVGLAKLMNGDRDMAAIVIGHEYGHLVLGHLAAAEQRRALLTLLGELAGAFIEAKTQTKTHVQGLGMDVGLMGTSLISYKFDRDQERQADEFGFRAMVNAGFSPMGAVRFAEVMQRYGSGGIGLFFDDHPGWPERTARFQALIKDSPTARGVLARVGDRTALASASAFAGKTQVALAPVYETNDPERSFADGVAAVSRQDFQTGITALRTAAATGYAPAQTMLGYLYGEGEAGLPKDDAEAVRLYRLAVAQGNALAMSNLGAMYMRGRGGLAVDQVEAVRLYRKAADLGNPTALSNLGAVYYSGLAKAGITKDDGAARKYWERASDAGNAYALASLGVFYLNGWGGLEKDIPKAIAMFRRAAENGSAEGQYHLGACYEAGTSETAKNEEEAAKWMRKAADQSHVAAEFELAEMYLRGAGGLPKNQLEAVAWLQRAAHQNHASAQYVLATFYYTGGGGLQKDEVKAAELFKLSAESGNGSAQAFLGGMYLSGQGGLTKSATEALRLFQLSAAQGDASGEFLLGTMYEFGEGGVAKDTTTALSWYRKAAAQGYPAATKRLSDLHVN